MNLQKLQTKIPVNVYAELLNVIPKFQINTALRLSHFLAQVCEESGNFCKTSENLNYSADRLLVVFPKYFKGVDVNQYAHNPEKIGNRVYANRMGNGNEASGDGYKYFGRGFLQLTGKSNYSAFDALVPENIIDNPSLVSTQYPLLSAAWFFTSNGLNAIADKGSGEVVVKQITKVINGGFLGLTQRIEYFNQYYSLLND